MESEAPAKTKEIPAQADVRIVGGRVNVKLRAYGFATLVRFEALLDELQSNASAHSPQIDNLVGGLKSELLGFRPAVGLPELP